MKEWVNVMARGGKIILSVIAAALTVASLLLVIIYAFLGVHVISYMASAEKGGADGLGAAVGLIVMLIVGVGILCCMLISLLLFALSRRMSPGVKRLVSVTVVYHVIAVVLAIITLVAVIILS